MVHQLPIYIYCILQRHVTSDNITIIKCITKESKVVYNVLFS